MLNTEPFVPLSALEHIAGSALFYPHCLLDTTQPVELFAPYVTDFWFADVMHLRLPETAGNAPTLSIRNRSYRLVETFLRGNPSAQEEWRLDESVTPAKRYRYLEPSVLTETYEDPTTGIKFRIHRRRGYSYSAFRKEAFTLGVFFYRGDGDSTTPWLSTIGRGERRRSFIGEVLDRLIDGGLLVTDGSRCNERRSARDPIYDELKRFFRGTLGAAAVDQAQPFTDRAGRRFQCIGYADERNGPTLVWQVWKSNPGG